MVLKAIQIQKRKIIKNQFLKPEAKKPTYVYTEEDLGECVINVTYIYKLKYGKNS